MIPKVGISEGKEPLFYNESHHAWREEVRKFVSKEIAPFVEEWEEAGEFPRELYKKAADVGLMGMGYDEKYGGIANMGTRPTVDGQNPVLEVHILEYSGNLYGKKITVEFIKKVRDEKKI